MPTEMGQNQISPWFFLKAKVGESTP